jgi:hypothetical protein
VSEVSSFIIIDLPPFWSNSMDEALSTWQIQHGIANNAFIQQKVERTSSPHSVETGR